MILAKCTPFCPPRIQLRLPPLLPISAIEIIMADSDCRFSRKCQANAKSTQLTGVHPYNCKTKAPLQSKRSIIIVPSPPAQHSTANVTGPTTNIGTVRFVPSSATNRLLSVFLPGSFHSSALLALRHGKWIHYGSRDPCTGKRKIGKQFVGVGAPLEKARAVGGDEMCCYTAGVGDRLSDRWKVNTLGTGIAIATWRNRV